jgi:hypothetical protein
MDNIGVKSARREMGAQRLTLETSSSKDSRASSAWSLKAAAILALAASAATVE